MFNTPDDLLARLTIIHILRDASPEECMKAAVIILAIAAIVVPITILLAVGFASAL